MNGLTSGNWETVERNNQTLMALHGSLTSLLKDSLPEFLKAAELCLSYRKPDGGSLGCPAAGLMFSIADSLGSYHRRRLVRVRSQGGRSRRVY